MKRSGKIAISHQNSNRDPLHSRKGVGILQLPCILGNNYNDSGCHWSVVHTNPTYPMQQYSMWEVAAWMTVNAQWTEESS